MKKKKTLLLTPTEKQFTALNEAYQYFNKELFGGVLSGCILNFSRKKNTHGFLAPERWRRVGEKEFRVHEISLTPSTFYRKPIEIFSTLVHEQVHLWQWDFGKPSRSGYHNKEWANKMEEVGLMPSHTGREGGKRTGQNMTHYIIKDGKYEQAFKKMPKKFLLPFTPLDGEVMKALLAKKGNGNELKTTTGSKGQPTVKSRQKTKYTCQNCKINVWGKPNLKINCGSCGERFKAV